MREDLLSSSTLPAARCDACGTTVLTHLVLDAAGEASRCCVRCDRPISADLEWRPVSDLADLGYELGAPRAKAGGCGSGSCGSRKH